MTEMDVAKMMFGWANVPTSTMLVSSSAAEGSNVRYGTVIVANEDGTYDVQLDTGEVITMESETPLEVGDRVSLVNQDGSWVLYGMATFTAQMENKTVELAKQIEEKGEEISKGVLESLAEFEESHGLTDMNVSKTIEDLETSITTTFVGEITEGDIEYKTLSELTQSVGVLESKAETYFSDDAEGIAKLQSTIQQNPQIIQSTVQSEVENAVGDTYATKTELKQTSDSLSLSVSGAVSTANNAKSTADSNELFIDTHFIANTTGLTIKSSASSYKTRVTTSSFDILNTEDKAIASLTILDGQPVLEGAFGRSANGTLTLRAFDGSYAALVCEDGVIDVSAPYGYGLTRSGRGSSGGDGNYVAYTVLYDNSSGTSGTVTLNYSAAYFDFIEIEYTDNTRKMTKRVSNPNGKAVALDRIVCNSTEAYMMSSVATISGRSITRANSYQIKYTGSTWSVNAYNFSILRVIGWGC